MSGRQDRPEISDDEEEQNSNNVKGVVQPVWQQNKKSERNS